MRELIGLPGCAALLLFIRVDLVLYQTCPLHTQLEFPLQGPASPAPPPRHPPAMLLMCAEDDAAA